MDAPVISDEMLDVEGVAGILNVSVPTVRRLYSEPNSDFPVIRIGKRPLYRFRRVDIEKWMEERVRR
jgi:excisionase family DNA binding protein